MLEHPAITRINLTGYANAEPEHCGTDFFGDEIIEGDDVVIFDDVVVLRDSLDDSGKLERFLYHLGFEFKTMM